MREVQSGEEFIMRTAGDSEAKFITFEQFQEVMLKGANPENRDEVQLTQEQINQSINDTLNREGTRKIIDEQDQSARNYASGSRQ